LTFSENAKCLKNSAGAWRANEEHFSLSKLVSVVDVPLMTPAIPAYAFDAAPAGPGLLRVVA
jgi:hypothetical protein